MARAWPLELSQSVRWFGVCDDIEALKDAEDAVQAADRRKDAFMAALSHELRNPLAPIKNSLHVLRRADPGSDQAQRAFGVIERQVDQLARLVDDLLDVTRLNEQKIQLKRRGLDLGALVQRAADDYRSVFTKAGVALYVLPPEEQVFVDADAVRMTQVVGNLLQNAAKFTQRGGRTMIQVHIEGEDAVVGVRDNGVGMDVATLAKIFEPFEQGDNTLARSRGGLGLGLSLVRGLVELHGGSVSVESEGLGRGAELTVRLPLRKTIAVACRTDPPTMVNDIKRRVLVIEDNIDAGESLKEALELDGHDVRLAYNGRDGVEQAIAFEPDVVFCDIGLPEMDGYEVAQTLREHAARTGTTLVALSGYAQPEDVERARAAGFHRHLSKPPSIDDLERVIRESGRRHADQGTSAA